MWDRKEVGKVGDVKVVKTVPGFVEETLGAEGHYFVEGESTPYESAGDAFERAEEKSEE